jgi:transcriptional regulator GlxA family with amidase domain
MPLSPPALDFPVLVGNVTLNGTTLPIEMPNTPQHTGERSGVLIAGQRLKDLDKRVQKALELLQQRGLSTQMPLSAVASSVHMSSSHLRHLIKREIGMSATHYVKILRLKRARQLLESSFLSVKEVMSSVGMNDISHFVREYKSVFGCTPSQSRGLAPGRSGEGRARNFSQ